MKKLLAIILALASVPAFAEPTDITVRQRRADDLGYLDRFIAFPAGGVSCLFALDGPTILPGCYTLGTGLSLSGTVLSATAADLSTYATNAALTAGLATKFNTPAGTTAQYVRGNGSLLAFPTIPPAITLTTTGTGAATLNTGTGALNIPTPATPSPFNYGAPAAKTVAVSTAYQAADPARAAVVTVTPACTNTTTILAASACTMNVRQSAAAGLTCSTGTVVATWSSTIALGLVITQGNSFPLDIKLPIGGYFAICPTAGTFTITAVEQTAG